MINYQIDGVVVSLKSRAVPSSVYIWLVDDCILLPHCYTGDIYDIYIYGY